MAAKRGESFSRMTPLIGIFMCEILKKEEKDTVAVNGGCCVRVKELNEAVQVTVASTVGKDQCGARLVCSGD